MGDCRATTVSPLLTEAYHRHHFVQNQSYKGYLLDLRALLGFERCQSSNKGLPLGSVKDHLGSIGGVADLDFS